MKPNVIKLGFNEYVHEETKKDIVVLHHSAGWDNARGMYDWWRNDKYKNVCTAYGMVDDGSVYEGFDPKYWGWAIKAPRNDYELNRRAIQIEVCNWGCLTEKNGKLYSWANVEVPKDKAVKYDKPFRGYVWYERYTDAEIDVLRRMLEWFRDEFGVSLAYNDRMFDVCDDAIDGAAGVWAHVSYRADKSDIHPQPEMVDMLKSLNTIVPGRSQAKDI